MVMMGDVVTMECNMDTQGAKVMWMKWMKDGQEIMMMEPNKAPITKDVEGVTLDVSSFWGVTTLLAFCHTLQSTNGFNFTLH